MIICDCNERISIEINSYQLFVETKHFFEVQVKRGIFIDIPVEKPYYVGYNSKGETFNWYANKWYKCMRCGTLWEFRYPDFPAKGFVKKFPGGQYQLKE